MVKSFIGAGVLPYAYREDGVPVFLLGKESKGSNRKKHNLYADFGGVRDRGESPAQTAAREFMEESMGVLTTKKEIKKLLEKPMLTYKNQNYYLYVVKIDYNEDIITTYNRMMNTLDKCTRPKRYRDYTQYSIPSCPSGLTEKSKLRWFTHEEIINSKDRMRAPFYDTYIKMVNRIIAGR